MGRKGKLKTSMTVQESVDGVKKHLNLSHVRLASTPGNFTNHSLERSLSYSPEFSMF